jgi:predicted protein tyrosine phosphatase
MPFVGKSACMHMRVCAQLVFVMAESRRTYAVAMLQAHLTKTHVVQTNAPLWYVYVGTNLMHTADTRQAAEAYAQTGGMKFVQTALCYHAMGPRI